MPLSAVDVIVPAFQHMKQQLLNPFRLGQWTRLAVVGLLAGELSSGGCNGGYQIPYRPENSNSQFLQLPGLLGASVAFLALAITLAIVVAVVVWIVVVYLNSRMRFVLFDSVIAKECHIRRFWRQRGEQGFQFFVWQILFSLAMLACVVLFIGIPLGFAFGVGWLADPRQHLLPLILGGILVFLFFCAFIIFSLLVMVLTKDFVVPQMALEGITAREGWRRLWPMMKEEKGGYAVYIGLKIAMSIAAAILVGIVAIVAVLILLIPVGGVGLVAILGGSAAGLSWNFFTIAIAVAVGIIVLATILCIGAMISVPATVFFPAYSLYFFAARYPLLAGVLYPSPSPAPSE